MSLEQFSLVARAALVEGVLTEAVLHVGADGRFAEAATVGSRTIAVDDGTLILPGFVDLHVNFFPRLLGARPSVAAPASAAATAYEAVLMASGVTTAFHVLRVHRWAQEAVRMARTLEMFEQFHGMAQRSSIDLFANIALEVLDPQAVDLFFELVIPQGSVVSLTEHVPDHREFRARPHALGDRLRGDGVPQENIDELISARMQVLSTTAAASKEAVARHCRQLGIPVFSRDDEFEEDVNFAVGRLGVVVSEFPLTERAAAVAAAHGIDVVVGAPNVLRGASHVGNVSARSLIEQNYATILSGDYIPHTILPALTQLRRKGLSWAALCRATSLAPATAAGLSDRGQIAPGAVADFVRLRESDDGEVALVELWKAGVCRLSFEDPRRK